jgi:predicted DNA-binding WGR domain protein
MLTRYFELQNPKASFFWAICCDQESQQIRQGKVGTAGKVQIKTFANAEACLANGGKLISSQLAKGFQEIQLADIQALAQLSTTSCQSILANHCLPAEFWLWVAQQPEHDLLVAVSDHPQVTGEALEILAQSSYEDVAQLAKLHVNWSGQFSEDGQEIVTRQLQNLELDPKRKQVLALAALGAIPELLFNTLDLELRVAIAKQPGTAPHLLAQLAQDPHENVRKVVAGNPHAPANTLESLAPDRNLDVRVALAKNPHTPATALNQLADDVYEKVRKAVLKHPNTSGEALYKLRRLISYNSESVLAEAAKDPKMPPAILAQMACENHWWIRQSVAGNPSTLLEILNKLSADKMPYVRLALTKNPNVTTEILLKILDYRPSLEDLKRTGTENIFPHKVNFVVNGENYVICNPVFAEDERVLASAAGHPKLPLSVVKQLIQSIDAVLRLNHGIELLLGLVANPNVTTSMLEELIKEECVNQIKEALLQKYLDCYCGEHKPGSLQYNKIREELLEQYGFRSSSYRSANHEIKQLYWAIIKHPNSPENLRLKLFEKLLEPSKEDYFLVQGVVYEMIRYPKTPENILERLVNAGIGDPMHFIESPTTPINILQMIANSKNQYVREAVQVRLTQRNSTSASVDKQPLGLGELRQEKETCAQELLSLLKTDDQFCRLAIYFDTHTPAEVLTLTEEATHWLERYAIAQNPNTPADVLQQLTQDHNRLVQIAAQGNQKASLVQA